MGLTGVQWVFCLWCSWSAKNQDSGASSEFNKTTLFVLAKHRREVIKMLFPTVNEV